MAYSDAARWQRIKDDPEYKAAAAIRARKHHLMKTYGITLEQHEAMLEACGGLCEACGIRPAQHIDHDHTTGTVRGLLCRGCNVSLGFMCDDPDQIDKLKDYIVARRDGHPRTAH